MALESEDLKELVKLMVETEVISIMDEGLGEQIDILVSPLEHSGVKSNLDGANAKYEVMFGNNASPSESHGLKNEETDFTYRTALYLII